MAGPLLAFAGFVIRVFENIGDVDGALLERRSARGGSAVDENGKPRYHVSHFGHEAVIRGGAKRTAFKSINQPDFRTAESRGIFDEGLQDGLDIKCRTADDFEDLACRGLLFQRLADL